jgi:hypothetical protein
LGWRVLGGGGQQQQQQQQQQEGHKVSVCQLSLGKLVGQEQLGHAQACTYANTIGNPWLAVAVSHTLSHPTCPQPCLCVLPFVSAWLTLRLYKQLNTQHSPYNNTNTPPPPMPTCVPCWCAPGSTVHNLKQPPPGTSQLPCQTVAVPPHCAPLCHRHAPGH